MGCRKFSRSSITLLKSLCLGILNIAAKTSGKELISLSSAVRPSKQHCHKNGLANLNRLQIKIDVHQCFYEFLLHRGQTTKIDLVY